MQREISLHDSNFTAATGLSALINHKPIEKTCRQCRVCRKEEL